MEQPREQLEINLQNSSSSIIYGERNNNNNIVNSNNQDREIEIFPISRSIPLSITTETVTETGISTAINNNNQRSNNRNNNNDNNNNNYEEESEEEDEDYDDSEYPEGGWEAWKVVLGSFFGLLAVFGLLNSLGAIQAYISLHQLSFKSESQVSWIFSVL